MHYSCIIWKLGWGRVKEGDQWETGKELTYEHLSPETHRAGGFTNVISVNPHRCYEVIGVILTVFFNLNLFILIGGELLYNIVLVLPYINMNPPQVFPLLWEVGHRGSCCDFCQSVFSMFSCRSFIVYWLRFRSLIHFVFIFFHQIFFIYTLIYFNWRLITLQYCIGFAIHQHESTTGIQPRCPSAEEWIRKL